MPSCDPAPRNVDPSVTLLLSLELRQLEKSAKARGAVFPSHIHQ
jgi:hypothetical protein